MVGEDFFPIYSIKRIWFDPFIFLDSLSQNIFFVDCSWAGIVLEAITQPLFLCSIMKWFIFYITALLK